MKVFELERLLAQVRNKETEVMVGFTSSWGDYTDAEITNIDVEGVVGTLFIEAEEV